MAYTVDEFLKLDKKSLPDDSPRCERCTEKLQLSAGNERRMIGEQIVCDDCYFNSLSDLLEEHPPGLPFTRR